MTYVTSPPFSGGFLREVDVLIYLEHELVRLPADPSVAGHVGLLS